MVIANLALRFIVELIGVGALGFAAYQLPLDGIARIAVTLAAPLALIVAWAIVVAPNARNALTQPQRDALGSGLLVLVAVALAGAGQPTTGLVFGVVVVANWLLGIVLGRDRLRIRSATGNRHQE